MKKNKLSKPVLVIGVCAAVLAIIVAAFFWLYTGQITQAKIAVYKIGFLPAAFVGTHAIPLSELAERYEVLKTLPESVDVSAQEAKTLIFNKLVIDTKLELLSRSKKVKVSEEDISALYAQMAQNLTGGDEKKLEEAIDSYSALNKSQFQKQVLHIALLERGLKSWYHAQADLNKSMHETADKIVKAAGEGEDFAGLAARYSQDNATALFQGDSGFVAETELNPEVRSALADAKTDEIRVVPGTDGLHIIKLLGRDSEEGRQRIRVQHIFLPGSGFEKWLENELKNYRVRNLTARLSF